MFLFVVTSLLCLTVCQFEPVFGSNLEIITLPDGEMSSKLKHQNLTILQTSVGGYNLIQASNGWLLIIFWSFRGELLSCDYETDLGAVHNFEREVDLEFRPPFLDNRRNGSVSQKLTDNIIDDIITSVSAFSGNEMKSCLGFLHGKRFSLDRQELRLKRSKRDLMLFPGTQWCGSGYSGENFMQLGHNAAADRCCRDHDQCRHTIAPFTTKYHYFNYRFHTISHCRCDERFSNTGASNLIGKLFFNVVKTKCFILKKEKTCKRRTWWGTCTKKRKTRQAYIREPTPFVPRYRVPSRN